jgi:hypothetical protein
MVIQRKKIRKKRTPVTPLDITGGTDTKSVLTQQLRRLKTWLFEKE